MPTGYTCGVKDGTITEFRDFALQCARAFGALVLMRDDPQDAPIPQEFQPSEYYQKRAFEAESELAAVQAMTDEECAKSAAADREKTIQQQRRWVADSAADRARYTAMLDKARAWQPPTSEHDGLKAFMIEQLEESIRFDCIFDRDDKYVSQPELLSSGECKALKIKELADSLVRYQNEHRMEVARTQERNQWLAQLRSSL